MFNRKLLGALVIASTTLASMAAVAAPSARPTTSTVAVPSARPTTSTNCILKAHRVTSVTPYFEEERQGSSSIVQRLRGASFFVRAEPGLTAQWLRLMLDQHVAEMRIGAMRDCPLAVNGVTITVESAGPGFVVTIIARDDDQADEVLRRAQLLFG